MQTVDVYRVEHHESGRGPYIGQEWDGKTDLCTAHGGFGSDPRPTPPADTGLGYEAYDDLEELTRDAAIRHAFGSLAELRQWFDGWLGRLDGAGFVVRRYRVPKTHARVSPDTGQAVFDFDSAELVDEQRMPGEVEAVTQFAAEVTSFGPVLAFCHALERLDAGT